MTIKKLIVIFFFNIMKNLNSILENTFYKSIIGDKNQKINNIHFNSKAVKKNDLFIATEGLRTDGHFFIRDAIENGANTIICEKFPAILKNKITYVLVKNSLKILPIIAKNFFQNPSEKLKLIGVTGTNGKTSIATLLYRLFKKLNYKVGLISTIENFVDNKKYKSTKTTPDIISLNNLISKMVNSKCEYCFMEVSSHGIDQKRIKGLKFTGGIFTNLTHEHLDYHKNFLEYLNVKKSFFDNLPKEAFALSNLDDKNGKIILQNTKAKKFTYSLKNFSDFKAKILENHFDSTFVQFNKKEIWIRFIGEFNIYNLLAVYACAVILGKDKLEVLKIISNLKSVNGRLETIYSKEKKITVIIDYAHTPDALKNVLETVLKIKKKNQNLITVIGAGGDRDKEKRSKMGKIASILSDKIILTSDNPRTENPEEIISDIKKGISNEDLKKVISITNRREAIKTAILFSKKNDIIMIAGKGHENYQEINGVFYDFNDKEISENFLFNF